MDEQPSAVQSERAFEDLIIEVMGSFVNPRLEDVDELIVDTQRRIVSCLGLDHGGLACLDGETGTLRVTHSWAVPGVERMPEHIGQKEIPHCLSCIRAGDPVVVRRVEELPLEAVTDRTHLESLGVTSMVMFPVAAAGQLLGALTFSTIRREIDWKPTVVRRLQFTGEALANLLLGRQQSRRLNEAYAKIRGLTEHLEWENVALREEIRAEHAFFEIVGGSSALARVLRKVDRVASTDSWVLLQGETGTGKELIARALHARSRRAERALVKLNCAALPVGLVENELFGHGKGALTDASQCRAGRLEMADGATLFLNEIGELSPECQSKLLRVLQSGEFERIGSSVTRQSDVRIIAATGRDLEQAVTDGRFRPGLLSRLDMIEIPPLRERAEDIPALTTFFIERFRGKLGKRIDRVAPDTMDRLTRYSWPGNVRELASVVERAMIGSRGSTLKLDDGLEGIGPPTGGSVNSDEATARPRPLVDVERDHIRSVCERCGWRIRGTGGAAEILGLNPSTLHSRMKRLGIRRPSVAHAASHGGRRPSRVVPGGEN